MSVLLKQGKNRELYVHTVEVKGGLIRGLLYGKSTSETDVAVYAESRKAGYRSSARPITGI